MIAGKGLLARAFEPHFGADASVVVFASGVSNSLETRSSEFSREDSLLRELLATRPRRFVYFGSCGVTAAQAELTPYMQHKKRMESIALSFAGSLVIRLPQVVGPTDNPHTLTNFIRDRIVSGEQFMVWANAERNLIDICDVVGIASILIRETGQGPRVTPIAAKKSLLMPQIVGIFERVLGKPACCSTIEAGSRMDIDTTTATAVGSRLGIDLGDGYIERVIRKYYARG
ncbi:MAG: NAD-dependent epimerase/dehydratase family protein [Rhodanobacter sp.]